MSKKVIATQVFTKMTAAGASRKDIIAAIAEQAQLSVNGAATYYNNVRTSNWGQTAPVATPKKAAAKTKAKFFKLNVDSSNPFDLMVKSLTNTLQIG